MNFIKVFSGLMYLIFFWCLPRFIPNYEWIGAVILTHIIVAAFVIIATTIFWLLTKVSEAD